MILGDGLMIVLVSCLLLGMAVGNGHADPVGQHIVLLQRGNTAERRDAVEVLARLGDQRAVQALVGALKDKDSMVREYAEQALWRIWHRSGNSRVDQRLQQGIMAMQQGEFERAVDLFTRVIELAPEFAEGYNKRATTYYLMRDYEKSIADCDKTLELNPVHFGALSGAGLCYLGLRDLHKALEYFERAVTVNPNMPQIQQYIEDIKKFFRDQSF